MNVEYRISNGADDGNVNLTTSTLVNNSLSLLIGWDFWDDTGDYESFWFFRNINIPKGSLIINAQLTISVYRVNNGYVNTNLKIAQSNDLITDFTGFNNLVGGSESAITNFQVAEGLYISTNVTNLISEKVNSDTWNQGNNILLYTNGTTKEVSSAGVDLDSKEYNNNNIILTIQYTPPIEITLNDIFEGNRIESYKYELLKLQNGSYVHNSYIDDYVEKGKITTDFTRDIISTAQLTISDEVEINYISDLIKIYYVVTYQGTEYNFPLGQYFLNAPKRESNGAYVKRIVDCSDMLLALEQDKLTASITYPIGTNVINTIKGLIGTWKYSIEPNSETLTEPMSYAIGKSKLFVINSLLKVINYYPLWSNGNGVFQAIPWDSKNNVHWTFEDNNKSLYESGIDSEIDLSNMYNRVIIVCNQATANTEPLTATRTFEDEFLSSVPFSYTSLGRYITKVFESEATTQQYVDLRARRELLKMLEIEESIYYNHAFITSRFTDGLPFQGDSYIFKNSLLGIDSVYKIESMKFELKTGGGVYSKICKIYTNI